MAKKTPTLKERVESSKIKVNPHYDVSAIDIAELCETEESAYSVANIAFHYGYYQGVKAAKAETRRAK